MPTQTELEFYKAFGIEGQPEITDKHLLKFTVLRCLTPCPEHLGAYREFILNNENELKDYVLKFILYSNDYLEDNSALVRKVMGVE